MDRMTDPLNPHLFGTQKEYAWDAWKTKVAPLTPSKELFDQWWEGAANQRWNSVRDLMIAAWNNAVAEQTTFDGWWNAIVEASKNLDVTPKP